MSLWEINHADAKARILARRDRISSRLEAAKKLTTLIKVGQMFGDGFKRADGIDREDVDGNLVAIQCMNSRKAINDVLENGNELVSNVRLAADHLQSQHQSEIDERTETLQKLLSAEERESEREYKQIEKQWPKPDTKNQAPMELYSQILKQKDNCNVLLEKKNDLIALLEDEIKESDLQYKNLIDDYHENVTVLSSRMESQMQAMEKLILCERKKIEQEFEKQRTELRTRHEENWHNKLSEVDAESDKLMEDRIQLLHDNENELDRLILEDSEAFVDMKHEMEDNIRKLRDQLQFLDAIHQLNEERLDYEIHVLRKHDEEVVLVKSEQKRKITSLQDAINKLRQKVSQCHKSMAKEEGALQNNITDIQKQMQKLKDLRKSHSKKAHIKKMQIIEMVRDELMEQLDALLDFDHHLTRTFMTSKAQKVALFLDPLMVSYESSKKPSGRKPTLDSGSGQGSKSFGSTPGGASNEDKSTSSIMRSLFANLVTKASFLVEENLEMLVEHEDMSERERELFRLDSILNAIGVEGEAEIFEALKRHKDDPEQASTDVLKIIRSHVEHGKKCSQSTELQRARSSKQLTRSSAVTSAPGSPSGAMGSQDGATDEFAWRAMIDSFDQLLDQDRTDLLEQLKKLNFTMVEVDRRNEEVQSLRRQVREAHDIAQRMGVTWTT